MFGRASSVYLPFILFAHVALAIDLGEERRLVDGESGDAFIVGVRGACIRVSLFAYVGFASLLLEECLILHLLLPFLVFFPVIILYGQFAIK